MREILFRGKRIDNSKWVYGSLITMDDRCSFGDTDIFSNLYIMEREEIDVRLLNGCESFVDNCIIQIHEEAVGQFTGFTDKNGAKIFEGDIVILTHYGLGATIAEIKYIPNVGSFMMVSNEAYYSFNDIQHDRIKIIGNIYNNSELIS